MRGPAPRTGRTRDLPAGPPSVGRPRLRKAPHTSSIMPRSTCLRLSLAPALAADRAQQARTIRLLSRWAQLQERQSRRNPPHAVTAGGRPGRYPDKRMIVQARTTSSRPFRGHPNPRSCCKMRVASAGPARRAPSLCRTRSHGPHHDVIPEIQLVRGDRAPRICPNKKKGEYRRSTAPSSLRGLTRQDTCPDPDRTTSARPAHQQHPVRHRHYPVCVPHHPHSVYSRSPPTPRPRFRCSNS